MTPALPHAHRRPWYRFTIRRALLAVPAAALIVLLIVGINPFRPDPMEWAVAEATAWCRTSTASFYPADRIGPPANLPAPTEPCVLKVGCVGAIIWDRRMVMSSGTNIALAPDGRLREARRSLGGNYDQQSSLSRDTMAAFGPILPTLPPSAGRISLGPIIEVHMDSPDRPQQMTDSRALVLGFHDGKAWVTRVYDRTNLPPAVARLLAQLGIDPTLP